MDSEVEREAGRIADEIVAMVERADGPVTLYRLQRQVGGFGASEPPYREIYREGDGGRVVYWADMTAAGAQALDNVMFGNRVAVEHVDVLPYVLEGGALKHEEWQPIVLLPAKEAN